MARKRTLLIPAAVLGTLLLTAAVLIFYFNARPVSKRLTVTVEPFATAGDPAFRRTLEHLLGGPALEGNRITVLRDGEEIFPAMLEAIAGARHSVTLETYEYYGDEVAGAFAEALAERAEAGMSVHVILDFIGSRKAENGFFETMTDAGVELVRYRKPSWYRSTRFNHRTHRKLLVVDGRVGFTGGANLGDSWVGDDPETTYRDNHFIIEGPAVGRLQAAFLDNWLLSTGGLLLGEAYFPELDDAGNLALQTVNSSPREGHKHIRTLLLLAFSAAREHIRISTAFFAPDPTIMQALIEARERGVEIDIIAPGEKIGQPWVRLAAISRWGPLLKKGIRIHEYQDSRFHAKLFIVDDQWVSFGSANFDNRSFRINDETNVNVFNAEFARDMIRIFNDDLSRSSEYTLEDWENRPPGQRLRGLLGNFLGPQL
ncbi:MAG: cardiolipin synthase B [Puniceicoccaceae bacterium]|nr:MAG: cardiolipin synthase B [Puniceicoccaceae bacterium]